MNNQALFQLGMDLEFPSTAQTEEFKNVANGSNEPDGRKDHFIMRDGVACAGTHLIIDIVGGTGLDDIPHVDATLRQCVEVAGATLLHIHLHHFTPNDGVSGVAVLAESHISIHTWPERDYAALDVFMCGDARPHECVEVLRRAFAPKEIRVTELLRGESV